MNVRRIPGVERRPSDDDRRVEGYPLASLQLADGGRYISELSTSEEEQLWQAVLGEPLRCLVVATLLADRINGH